VRLIGVGPPFVGVVLDPPTIVPGTGQDRLVTSRFPYDAYSTICWPATTVVVLPVTSVPPEPPNSMLGDTVTGATACLTSILQAHSPGPSTPPDAKAVTVPTATPCALAVVTCAMAVLLLL